MWFRRADADDLREKARRFHGMAIDHDDRPVSARVLRIANELEAKAEEDIAVGHSPPVSS